MESEEPTQAQDQPTSSNEASPPTQDEDQAQDNEDEDKLKTGEIIGIVFGCVAFLLIVITVAIFLAKKFEDKSCIFANFYKQ